MMVTSATRIRWVFRLDHYIARMIQVDRQVARRVWSRLQVQAPVQHDELHMSGIKTESYRQQRYVIGGRARSAYTPGISVCNGPTPSTDDWRIMTPAFGVAQIRLTTEIFSEKAVQNSYMAG
ncbi:hypothetical protein B0H14DRAFT_2652188 [Mycena olivaceomarginata]|nr:hypothetical protein B0H14DRAFT_2652188 [Mycena olivaceomarginata]